MLKAGFLLGLLLFVSASEHTGHEEALPHDASQNHPKLGTVLFLTLCVLIGALTRHCISKFCPGFPYTVALLAVGLLIGIAFKHFDNPQDESEESVLHGYTGLINIDPHLLFYVFLPVLLFESAFLLDIHAIKKSIGQILVLAIPGYLLSSLITAIIVKFILDYTWSNDWNVSMMVGSILSATDPVAVVALLKNSPGGKDVHHLSIVIEGESLLNDGAAIVMFNIFQHNAMKPCDLDSDGKEYMYSCSINGHVESFNSSVFCDKFRNECEDVGALGRAMEMCSTKSWEDIVTDILIKTLGGPLIGIAMGYIFVYWLGKVFNDYLTEITITVGSPYLVWFVSEHFLHSSGVLSVVLFGCIVNMNKMNISPEIEKFLNKFWEQMGYLVNTIIFLLTGVIITYSCLDIIEWVDVVYLLALYLGVSVSRSFMLILFHFVLSKIGYGSTWQSASVLMWGALRGAVSLALGLEVQHNTGFCKKMRHKILFFVSGIVVLTLLVNSTTFNKVLYLLGFCHVSKAKKIAVDTAAVRIMKSMTEQLSDIKKRHTHTDSNWAEIKKVCYVDTIYNVDSDLKENRSEIEKLHNEVTACKGCSTKVPVPLTKAELSEFYDESRNRVFKAFKISLWKQFDLGLLSKPALRFLDDTCDQTLDISDKFIELSDIEFNWKIGRLLSFVKYKLEHLQKGGIQEEYPIPNNINQYKVYELVSSTVFELVIMSFIFVNVAIVIVELSISRDKCENVIDPVTKLETDKMEQTEMSQVFGYVNYCFLALFIFEMILKLIGQRKYYFYHKWNLIDFAIILISIADSISDVFTNCETANVNFNVFRIIRIVRLFRCVRLIKWIFLFLHQLTRKLIYKSISHGYEIGLGFIEASADVLEHIDHIVAYEECREVFREKITKASTDVNASMGEVRKEFHGIPIAITTKQVIRLVLNKGRETALELLSAGLVEEIDAALFTKQIEEKMKRLLASPVLWLPPPDAYGMFVEAPWLKNLKSHIVYRVVKCAIHQMYSHGETFLEKGSIASGVFLILSGKAKVVQSLEDLNNSKTSIHKANSLHLACHHSHNDYLGAGSIVGEQSILVNRPRGSYVVCETDLQCYFISAEDMHGLMLKYPIIEENLWRVCSIRMAQSLFAKSKYKTKTYEDLKIQCERSVLATLVPETNNGIFEIDSMITDVVVVYGECKCFPSNTLIVGPKIVPDGTSKLSLITPSKLLILISPEYNIDLDLYNAIPLETARSEIEIAISNASVIEGTESIVPAGADFEEETSRIRLSDVINRDPNPKTRQEFEKKRRMSHLNDAHLRELNSPSPGPGQEVTFHTENSSYTRLTPVENVDK